MASFYEVILECKSCCNIDKNMKLFLSILLVILCLIQFSCNSGSDIEGQVLDSQNNPVEGVTIKLVVWDEKKDELPTKVIETTKTEKNGAFAINVGEEKPETKLRLAVEKDGFKMLILKFTPLLIQKNASVFKNYKILLEKQ